MKTIAALTVFGVLALALAGASGAQGGSKPPFGVPDPARLVLRSADLGGARVGAQGYYHDKGFVASYQREFDAPRVAGTPLFMLESDAEVAAPGTDVRSYVTLFREFASTAAGRAQLEQALTSVDASGLVLSHVTVGLPRPIPGTNGVDVAIGLRLVGIPAQAHMAVFSQSRFLGELLLLGVGGRPVTRGLVARLARIVDSRFAAAQPPASVAAPMISGTPAVGQALTASPGTWTNGPNRYRFQWGRCGTSSCNDISGATGTTYVPSGDDAGFTLRVRVTATNANGSRNAVSAATTPVVALPATIDAPVITGKPVVGETLTTTTGTWTQNPTSFSFAWKACDATGVTCTTVAGDTQTYVVAPGDVGSRLVAVVTARNAAGSTTVESAPTAIVVAPTT
jgi:hypothetical protein